MDPRKVQPLDPHSPTHASDDDHHDHHDHLDADDSSDEEVTRQGHIASNRKWQGFWEFLNNSNMLATAAEFLTKPAEAFSNLWFVKWINAPLAMVTSLFLGFNAIRKAAIKKDGFSIANAFVVFGTSAAMFIGALAVAASIGVLAAAAPVLIAASLGVKALWDLGTALVYGIKAACTRDEDLKLMQKNRALSALFDGVVGGLITAAVVAVYMVAAPIVQTILTGFAIGAAAIGVIAAVVKMSNAAKHAAVEDRGLEAARDQASSSCCVGRSLGHRASNASVLSTEPPAYLPVPPSTHTSSLGRGPDVVEVNTQGGRGMGRGMLTQ